MERGFNRKYGQLVDKRIYGLKGRLKICPASKSQYVMANSLHDQFTFFRLLSKSLSP